MLAPWRIFFLLCEQHVQTVSLAGARKFKLNKRFCFAHRSAAPTSLADYTQVQASE